MNSRWRRMAAAALLVGAALVASPGSAAAGTLDQEQEASSGVAIVGSTRVAQTFAPAFTGKLDQVDVKISKYEAPPDPLTFELRSTSGGYPAAVLASATVSASDPAVPSGWDGAWVSVSFESAPHVKAGTQYAIVLSTTGSPDGFYIWATNPDNPYPSGLRLESADGSSWDPYLGEDVTFRTYVARDPGVSRVEYISTPEWETGHGVDVDASGNVYVAGRTRGDLPGFTNAGNYDGFLRKYTPSGTAWTRQFGTDKEEEVGGVVVDGSGNVYVAGYTYGSLVGASLGDWDGFLRKYSSAGDLLWARQFGTDKHDEVHDVAVDASGNVYVGGFTDGAFPGYTFVPSSDGFVRSYTRSGVERWTRQFSVGAEGDYERIDARGIAVDGGTVYLVGSTTGALPGSTYAGGYADAFIRTYTTRGAEGWTRQFGTASWDVVKDVEGDGAGTVFLAGQTETSQYVFDGFVQTFTSTGDEGWGETFGSSANDIVNQIAVDRGTAYVVSTSGGEDGELHSFLPDGTAGWSYVISSVDGGWDYASGVAVNGSGGIYVTGMTGGELPDSTDPEPYSEDAYLLVVDDPAPRITSFTARAVKNAINLAFSARDDADAASELTYRCRLDAGDWTACSSATSHTFSGVTAGQHTVWLQVSDGDGWQSSPMSRRVRVGGLR